MRNYIAEIKSKGYTYKQISRATGVDKADLQDFRTGRVKLSSTSADYERIRNANRRLAYKQVRRAGLSSKQATRLRRTMFDPELKATETETTRIVRAKQETTRYQLRILGDFYNAKTKQSKISEGYSHAYLEIDDVMMTEEAIAEAQSKLGGTNWKLTRILEHELMEYKLRVERAEIQQE